MNRTLCSTAALIGATLLVAGCAVPNLDAGTGSSLVARADALMRQAAPSRPVFIRIAPEQVRTGDVINAEVATPVGGHLYIFQVGTSGTDLTMIFPNAVDGANYLPAGSALKLPRPNWQMAARGPAGVGYLVAVVTDAPLNLMALQAQVQQQRLEFGQPYGAAMAVLREVAP